MAMKQSSGSEESDYKNETRKEGEIWKTKGL
jgi:hypothetical protein